MNHRKMVIARLPRLLFMILILSIIFFAINQEAIAGTKGKIAGVIKDSETGEELPGANILLVGTVMGAAADNEGHYFVINVPPGTYSVQARMMGYEPVTMTDVIVSIDHTTRIDFELRPTAVEVPGITITAKREIIKLDVSATQIEIASEDLIEMPVANIADMLLQQAGIELSQDVVKGVGLSIRGGDIEEAEFKVDNVTMKSPLTQTSNMSVPKSATKRIQLLQGGFNAEYGQVRSGLLNIITEEGDPEKISGNVIVRGSSPGRKHFGPDVFDKNGRIWDVYAGDKAFEGVTLEDVALFDSTNGEEGYAFTFRGWNDIAAEYAADDDPDNDLTPQQCLELWKWRHRPRDYADEFDYEIDATLSGPLFSKTTFSTSYRREQNLYAYPLSRKKYISDLYMLKLTSRDIEDLKLSLHGIFGKRTGSVPTRRGGSGSGIGVSFPGSWGPISGIATGDRYSSRFIADNFAYDQMFKNSIWCTGDEKMFRIGLEATYALSSVTYFDFRYTFGKDYSFVWRLPPRYVNPSDTIFLIGNLAITDSTPHGSFWPDEMDQDNIFSLSGNARRFDLSSDMINQLRFDFTSQINKYNQIKAGIAIDLPSLEVRSRRQCWVTTHGNLQFGDWYREGKIDTLKKEMEADYEANPANWQWWNQSPLIGGIYIQDKLEWEGMIANFGIRLEYLNPRTDAYAFENDTIYWDTYYTEATFGGDAWYETKRINAVSPRLEIQPRIGLSFPVSENSKVYFNYGHFYQAPNPYLWYTLARPLTGPGFVMPSPELESPRTVSYELGYEQNIRDMFLVHLAAYYKDITGEQMLRTAYDWDHTVATQFWENKRYRDIRGVELRLSKPWGKYITFWTNYNYMITSSGYTDLPYIYENPLEAEAQEENAEQDKPHVTPKIRAGLTLAYPIPVRPFNNISVSLMYRWDAGDEWIFETVGEEHHWIKNVDVSNTDMRAELSLSFGPFNGVIFMDVYNLFNQKYLYTGGMSQEDALKYRESLKLPWEEGDEQGNDRWGEWEKDYIHIGWRDWIQFLNPRDIFFGVRLNF